MLRASATTPGPAYDEHKRQAILLVAGSLMVGAFLAFLWKQCDYFNITTIDDFLGRIFGAYLVLYSSSVSSSHLVNDIFLRTKLVTHSLISSVKFFRVQYLKIVPDIFNNPLPWFYPY
jgi:hypothetical protein